jgi:GT2 family glycosyltransferase
LNNNVLEIERSPFLMINDNSEHTNPQATMAAKSYVLITPCRNEADYIEGTLQSVIAQTIRPKKWIIVSDGSVDRTEEIVEQYTQRYDFIQLLRRPSDRVRNFGSKVESIELAYAQLKGLEFDFVGNLDGDITLSSTYYANILLRFEQNQRLGLAGGSRLDVLNGRFVKADSARNSVSGAVQLFRRKCYETIGGYQKLPCGGIDAVAETMARMQGWEVESFPDLIFYHHRPTGTADAGALKARFKRGEQRYLLGYHPLFHVVSCLSRMADYPFILGALAVMAGYGWAALRKRERVVPAGFVRYLRGEQRERLRSLFLARRYSGSRPLRLHRTSDQLASARPSSLASKIEE